MQDLYVRQLEGLLNAEHEIRKVLPRIAKEAISPELKLVLERHLQQTDRHIKRLEKVFQNLNKKPAERKCLGLNSLITEYEDVMNDDISTIIRDWVLIEAVKKLENYEISIYRSVRAYARLLGDYEAVSMFTRTMSEKYKLQDNLSQIADEQAKWLGHIYWASWRAGWGVFIGRPAN
ncbi:MAG TPA: DUF892 family protein [Nitrosomonas sp.]|nr:DUF892 family protein [Nitrosomonas sp.]